MGHVSHNDIWGATPDQIGESRVIRPGDRPSGVSDDGGWLDYQALPRNMTGARPSGGRRELGLRDLNSPLD